ncbi:MAG: hypothetical protein ACKOYK_14005 [Cyanobium sp.]
MVKRYCRCRPARPSWCGVLLQPFSRPRPRIEDPLRATPALKAIAPPDLSTNWLGLPLRSPLVVGAAAPLSEDSAQLLQLEEAGAAAIVLHSLFEEQLEQEQLNLHHLSLQGSESYGESLSYVPDASLFHVGTGLYLRHLEQARAQLTIPVVASLNGQHPGSWVHVARQLEGAGASAIELNIFSLPTDPDLSSAAIEAEVEEIMREVRAEVGVPLAVKLGPFFTNFASLARRLAAAGADGLTLFNRFYQPEIDIESLELRPNLLLSTPHDLRLPMRWMPCCMGAIPWIWPPPVGCTGAPTWCVCSWLEPPSPRWWLRCCAMDLTGCAPWRGNSPSGCRSTTTEACGR